MKKKKMNLLIKIGVMIAIGFALIIVNHSVTLMEPEDQLFGQKVELVSGQKVANIPYMSANSNNFELIDYKWIAKDKKGEVVGTVYRAIIKNDFALTGSGLDYGYIEFLIGISTDDEVYVQYITIYQSNWAVVGVQEYIKSSYDGIKYQDVEKIPNFDADIVSGATDNPAYVSTNAIKALVQKVVDEHFNLIEEDPLEDLYGIGYELEVDTSFSETASVTSKTLVKQDGLEVGYMYNLTDSAIYYGEAEGSIVMEIYFDGDDKVLGVLLPDESYEHTLGFKKSNLDYLDLFVGLSKAEFQAVIDDNSDLKTGATNSRVLIDKLFEAFISEVS